MQVQMTIDSAQMGDTVVAMFNNLTPEDRRGLMLEIMREWFKTPVDFETMAQIDKKVSDVREGKYYSAIPYQDRDKIRNLTDSEIRERAWFKQLLQGTVVTSREVMVTTCIEEARRVFVEEVREMVRTDADIQKMKDIVLEEVKKEFPATVHDALIVYFSSFMQQLSSNIANSSMQTTMMGNEIKNILTRMSGLGQF